MNDFANKIALITGAASGIGKALAFECAEQKMRVVIADINSERLQQVEAKLKALGVITLAVVTDVCNDTAIKELADKTMTTFGVPDLLINNAGVGGTAEPVWKMSPQTLHSILDINLLSMQRMLTAFVPKMLADNQSRTIVNVAAASGLLSSPLFANYQISKHGVVVLSECLYHDLKMLNSNIHVCVLCPGWVKTDILNNTLNLKEKMIEKILQHNLPENAIAWLLQFMRNVRHGMATSDVAKITFAAIKSQQFYIHTHEEFKEKIKQRTTNILASKTPNRLMD